MKSSLGDKVFTNTINIVMFILIIVMLYPFWDLLVLSFLSPADALKDGFHLWPTSFDLSAYKMVLNSGDIKTSFINSVFRVVVGTAISVVLTMLVAYPLAKRTEFPGYGLWMTLLLIPMYFSGGLIPTYLIYKSYGLINNWLVLLLPTALTSYNVIMTRNFLRSIPVSLEESARLDGAGELRIWWSIILPLSLPIMATVGLWSAIAHWNAYFDALIYMTDRDKVVLQVVLRRVLLEGQANIFMPTEAMVQSDINAVQPPEDQIKAAFIMVCTVPILLVYPFLQKYFMKGIMVGAVKG